MENVEYPFVMALERDAKRTEDHGYSIDIGYKNIGR